MNENKDTGISYVVMPMEILQNTELSATEKILYCYLTIFKKQCCFQSNERIEEATGIDVRSIQRGLKKLTDLGYIFIEFINNNSAQRRIYTILDNPKKLAYLAKAGMFNEKKPDAASEPVEEPEVRYATKTNLATGRPNRSDFASDDEYEQAFYKWNRVVV